MALMFNLSPSPIATAEILSWLMGSVENRSWVDVVTVAGPLALAGVSSACSRRGRCGR